ncbi:arylsulfatase A-like enzyme [Parabacteroides sp. PF5-5]|uniref:sulfatase family protein n=1 Tax=unclassified Parabacteroides TaxID=2649774 RepID=UPI0024770723|nr:MULTISPECIES: sulfatase [unclassified Parabacteroides]MDH6306360.1 arylsulfatase A-like enzyme [Parabacteroides sp. PH5-39]MDH6314632.1 arylsulfatase A-like enzyme [Parabacteroides sp. PF5-13]MDH6321071.1 arylsulfatase A-like enzyme [Parabacteroides sp. PH5-13]MDH6324803.1 arylsulfatase A-like enzyme [Parabacteroides sp. PH5-8]MDH6325516.1 arylsulfatase A-like enzyme [Parabacteroides sp. PH5-41]
MNKKLFFLSALGSLSFPAVAADYTNIILINLDDVGYGDFSYNGAYGYTTPNIDRMAAEGMRFTHFLAGQPISGASRAGLLTGCYPNRIGFAGAPGPGSDYGIHPDEMTMGELLKQKGYNTAIYGKWHLGDAKPFLPLQNGFDEYYGLPYSNDMWPFHPQQGEVFNFPDLPTYDGNMIVAYNTDQTCFTTDYTTRTVDFIKKNRKKPFFIYLAHSMPHVPLAVSDKFKSKSEQGLFGDVMMEIDWSVGEILKTLKESGLEENTLIVLTSDNGPWANYGNHAGSAGGLREAKATTFDGGNRIPCIMYWKGKIESGSTCNKLASNIDLFPTFAEITSAPLPTRKIDGVSLVPLIKGEEGANPRESFAYYFRQNDLEAVTDGSFKLVFPHQYVTYGAYVPGNGGQPGKLTNVDLTKAEMYDLRRDPGERYNVITQYPDVASKLMKIADGIREELGDNLLRIKGKERREPGKYL